MSDNSEESRYKEEIMEGLQLLSRGDGSMC